MLTLYASPRACSMAPHIILEEVEARYRLELVPLAKNVHRSEAYRAINPRQRVPALRVEWGVLTEASAILVHLAERFPERGLFARPGSQERARILEWLSWLGSEVHATGYGALWRPGRFHPEPSDVKAGMAETARETIIDAYRQIEGDIVGPFALGEQFTIVDAYLYVFFRWGGAIGLDMPRDYPDWTAWAARAERRPSVRRMLANEGQQPFFRGASAEGRPADAESL